MNGLRRVSERASSHLSKQGDRDIPERWPSVQSGPAVVAWRTTLGIVPVEAPENDRALFAAELHPRFSPIPVFAGLTGLRPEEWIGLERRDVDSGNGVEHIRRVFTDGELKLYGKQTRSLRAVPLPVRAAEALTDLPPRLGHGPPVPRRERRAPEPARVEGRPLDACRPCRGARASSALRAPPHVRVVVDRCRRVAVRVRLVHGHFGRPDR